MTDFLLDANGKLDLTTGDIQLVDGVDAIAQHCKIRLRTFLGEWFLDRRIGVPYYERILVKNPGSNVVRRILRQVISGTPGIQSLGALELDYDGAARSLAVTFRATTTDDQTLKFSDVLIVTV